MRYVIIDHTGSSRAHFDDADALCAAIDEIGHEDGALLSELAVLRYDLNGKRVGPASMVSRSSARSPRRSANGSGPA